MSNFKEIHIYSDNAKFMDTKAEKIIFHDNNKSAPQVLILEREIYNWRC
jgi:hypothetical protein